MKIVSQKTNTLICGHCCVAMISGYPLSDVIDFIGHDRGTSTKELTRVLRKIGFSCSRRAKRIGKYSILPDLCILISRSANNNKGNWHWILYNKGKIYDSRCRKPHEYEKYIKRKKVRITSYIEIGE